MSRPTADPYEGTPPLIGQPKKQYTDNANDFVLWLSTEAGFAVQVEALAAWFEAEGASAEQVLADAQSASNVALAAVNFVGRWEDQTGALAESSSVSHNGILWIAEEDIADVTASEPSGSNTDWIAADSGQQIEDRSSNTALRVYDTGKILNATGTFTQTIETIADLPTGWSVTIRNTGSGTITVDPAGAETINGVASIEVKAGQRWQIVAKASGFTAIRSGGHLTEFTASGTFNKSPDSAWIEFEVVNGGNSGAVRVSDSTGGPADGGAGGIAIRKRFLAEDVPSSVSVVVGAGGSPATATASTGTSSSDGNAGGKSSVTGLIDGIAPAAGRLSLFSVGDMDTHHNAGDGGAQEGDNGGSCVTGGAGGGSSATGSGGKSMEHGDGADGEGFSDADLTGADGSSPGGGSGGARVTNITQSRTVTSGQGGDGIVRVWEY